ncbi:MAG: hypothetical protein IPI39_20970 [Candidatus Obscuribacter sp.]|nr:hypothetical protein [Candidatus Obscuribacter sp.]
MAELHLNGFKFVVWHYLRWCSWTVGTIVLISWIANLFGHGNFLVPFERELIYIGFFSPYVMLILLTIKCQWLKTTKSIGIGVLWYFGMSSIISTIAHILSEIKAVGTTASQSQNT